MEKKIEYYFKKKKKKKLEYNNMRAEALKHVDTTMNNSRVTDNTLILDNNLSNNNQEKYDDNEEGEDIEAEYFNILDEIEKDDDIALIDEGEEKKVEKKNIAFSTSDKGKENPLSKTSREEFENIEKKFNEDYALKYILLAVSALFADLTLFTISDFPCSKHILHFIK